MRIGTRIEHLPSNLHKASVRQSRGGNWCLIDIGTFVRHSHTAPRDCLLSKFQQCTILNPWCFDHVDFPYSYEPLLQDITNGKVWIISDGSYNKKLHCGTAAWILEGKTLNKRILGKIITPGSASDLTAYRCELARILAAVTVINAIAFTFNVKVSLTLFCDCEKGIYKAFQENSSIQLHDACHDILKAIRYELSFEQIKWSGAHIKGHQDDTIPFDKLDRPSQLNVLVDHMAKEFLPFASETQHNSSVAYPSWSILLGNVPIIKDTDKTLYDLVHTPAVKNYWMKKQRAREDNFESINWTRIGSSLDQMPLIKRLFCSKHTAGMCGVGKFQQIWKNRESAACPHCGQFEDALQIWKCSADTVPEIWESSLKNLESSMHKLDTDPILLKIIIDYLNTWRSGELLLPLAEHKYRLLIELQETIGARCEHIRSKV
jgi:hypothetical protein